MSSPYCVFNLCALEEYCCGQNQCCRNSYSVGGVGIVCCILGTILVTWFIYRYYIRRPIFPENPIKRLLLNSTQNYKSNFAPETFAFKELPIESSNLNEISTKTSAVQN